MKNLPRLLKETLIIKDLSPERGAAFIGCSGQQVRRWISGEVEPSPVHRTAIEAGLKKINREIPGDKDGVVNWRGVEIPEEARIVDKKLNVFFDELVNAAKATGRRVFTNLESENLEGFEETVHLAKKLRVKLPVI